MSVDISKIRRDGGTQSRAEINEETVTEYAEAMADPDTVFPPITVYFDGRDYWLADGFHRLAAWERIGRTDIPAEIRQGDRRRAILHSCSANAAHGLRRTNADKRRAVRTLLEDDEWAAWSDREIARRCRVSDHTVAKYRAEILGLTANLRSEQRTYTTKHGTAATMNTANIGKQSAEIPAERADIPPGGAAGGPGMDLAAHSGPIETLADSKHDPDAALRREFRSMTAEGREDDWIALRQAHEEDKKRIAAQRSEIADLKAKIKEITSEDDAGRKIGNLMRRLDQSEGRSKEHQANAARLQRQVNAQKAEIEKLRRQVEAQEFSL